MGNQHKSAVHRVLLNRFRSAQSYSLRLLRLHYFLHLLPFSHLLLRIRFLFDFSCRTHFFDTPSSNKECVIVVESTSRGLISLPARLS